MDKFVQDLDNSFWPELLCLLTHVICALALIAYVYVNRKETPIIQNSPALTITAQIMLVGASFCLFAAKVQILQVTSELNQRQRYCFGQQRNQSLAILNSLYTFAIQFMEMTYLFKMIRVLLICYKSNFLTYIFKSEGVLILLAAIWAAMILTTDILMKIFMHSDDSRYLHLYPQFNFFMCDEVIDEQFSIASTTIYQSKLAFCLLLLIASFTWSYKLQEIDKDLKLRSQYWILLFLPYLVWLAQKIIRIVDPSINSSLPVHYVDCVSNLITGMLLFWIHFNSAKEEFFLPDDNDLLDVADLSYVLNRPEIYQILKSYFAHVGKTNIFKVNHYLMKSQTVHKNPTEEEAEMLFECLGERGRKVKQNNTIRAKQMDKGRQILIDIIQQQIKKWELTVSGNTLKAKLKQNSQYFSRMKQLKLVR